MSLWDVKLQNQSAKHFIWEEKYLALDNFSSNTFCYVCNCCAIYFLIKIFFHKWLIYFKIKIYILLSVSIIAESFLQNELFFKHNYAKNC